ncbi:protein THYLAKOID ASSEMBLY 8-like, chloroplastic [Abrus precatorius]|uniref:Protein THYLAKOID ASSEMBLY 8-like, chloroplastic n=1 Tax=Abrus precatorius TaxID=3816 RepID=A0A8B8KHP2_ABRPR|nr:protein THYLAKOID ASSEMBLY 8-like, chloroplastic [Abrus precatorius]
MIVGVPQIQWLGGARSFHRHSVKPEIPSLTSNIVRFDKKRKEVTICGLRSSHKTRRRSRVISKESIEVIHALKLAKSPQKLQQVLNTRLSRLLKPDVLILLDELQRQNQLQLSLTVFNFIREELGYDSLLRVYADMIQLLGRNKKTEMAEELFSEAVAKGLKPDTRICSEVIGAYLQVGMADKAMNIYGSMKEWGCSPDELTFTILIRSLEKIGQQDLAESLKQECVHYVHLPHKFVRQIQQKHVKKRHADLV